MNIIVPIKQVPETSNVRMDEETGTMIREGVESIVNPLDLYAIEIALNLKETYGARITVISMGPGKAEKAIKEAISMGCDDGILVSGVGFAGSDTWATSYALSRAIEKLSPFDLIITGVRATDGDTGQVGPGIASFLDLPLSTYTSGIKDIGEDMIVVERLVEEGYEALRLPLPCLLTVIKEISYPRLPTLRGKQRAREMEVPIWGVEELGADTGLLGLKGSPTRVVKIDKPRVTRNGRMIDVRNSGVRNAVGELLEFLEGRGLI